MPSFSHSTKVTNPLSPISTLNAVILAEVDGAPLKIETSACQCRNDQAMIRHVALVLLAFVVLQRLRIDPSESLATAKDRWHLTITRQGEPPPTPEGVPCPPPRHRVSPVIEVAELAVAVGMPGALDLLGGGLQRVAIPASSSATVRALTRCP